MLNPTTMRTTVLRAVTMSRMAEYAYELEYGDLPFDERVMVDPPEANDPKYNKEKIMDYEPDDCQINKAMQLDAYRQIGESLSWALYFRHFQLKWYKRLYVRLRVWLDEISNR